MALELTVVDAFTERPFTGNPAAVALMDEFPPEDRMQAIAAEMHLPETAFVVERGEGLYDLRWFSPAVEVALCGHATLATTHVLGRPARFQTKSGELVCSVTQDGLIEMDFPADPPRGGPAAGRDGARGRAVVRAGPFRRPGRNLGSAAQLRSMVPDLPAIERLGGRALIVTAAGDRDGIDCVSRVFGPATGIPEDPVTGSAHCTLAAFWGERLGRDTLTGEQASPRGGIVSMRRADDRVVLGGHAVTVSRVSLLV